MNLLKECRSFIVEDDDSTEATILSTAPQEMKETSSFQRKKIPPSQKKSVSFSKITIREYNVIAGDNPACSSGPPISLGWEYNRTYDEEYPVDVYEDYRCGQRWECVEDLKLNERVRYRMLVEWNVSSSAIAKAEKQCRLIREQRKRTLSYLIQRGGDEEEIDIKKVSGDFLDKVQRMFVTLLRPSRRRR